VKKWCCVAIVGLSTSSFADRIVNVPIGRSLSFGSLRYEQIDGLNERGTREQFLAISPIKLFEIEFRNRYRTYEDSNFTFDIARNLAPAITSTSPGISIGVLDTLNQTSDGRRGFIALTFKELLEVSDEGEPGELTLGWQVGSKNSGFVGTTLSLSPRTRLFAEHNGFRLTAGFDSEIAKGVRARIMTQDNLLLGGISLVKKF
jgi:hypothetical protein